jgi:hypothetical protein
MSDMENIGRKHDSENTIQVLMDTARMMTICKNEVNKATEKIIKSFNTQGTRGAVHKFLLLTKIEGLRRLAVLYRSVSKRYKNAAVKLAGGAPEDKVMAGLLPYNVFLSDQLRSEQECYEQVLSMLRVDRKVE